MPQFIPFAHRNIYDTYKGVGVPVQPINTVNTGQQPRQVFKKTGAYLFTSKGDDYVLAKKQELYNKIVCEFFSMFWFGLFITIFVVLGLKVWRTWLKFENRFR